MKNKTVQDPEEINEAEGFTALDDDMIEVTFRISRFSLVYLPHSIYRLTTAFMRIENPTDNEKNAFSDVLEAMRHLLPNEFQIDALQSHRKK